MKRMVRLDGGKASKRRRLRNRRAAVTAPAWLQWQPMSPDRPRGAINFDDFGLMPIPHAAETLLADAALVADVGAADVVPHRKGSRQHIPGREGGPVLR